MFTVIFLTTLPPLLGRCANHQEGLPNIFFIVTILVPLVVVLWEPLNWTRWIGLTLAAGGQVVTWSAC